ncbi:MAG: hypothetical protein HC888_18845, partial [Candidatus Competibacteraceae bacterium]|nr:hypothetical protein [Candidatus Competibacteraceae bacterium]
MRPIVPRLAGLLVLAFSMLTAPAALALATVTEVSSSTPDGAYNTGDIIAVVVSFSEVVTVTGPPRIQLETGATDRFATYASGSGSADLVFNYTVAGGDVSADLDYLATNALQLNGGAIVDGLSAPADLSLTPPGSAGSLRSNKDIVIDTAVPAVLNVNSSTPNGSYTVGEIIPIQITFNEPVVVTGAPFVTVETGTVDRQAPYDSGSGTKVLVFLYTVQAGDASLDLNLQTPMNLNGGTVRDLAENNYALAVPTGGATSLAGAKAIIIDANGPVVLAVNSPLARLPSAPAAPWTSTSPSTRRSRWIPQAANRAYCWPPARCSAMPRTPAAAAPTRCFSPMRFSLGTTPRTLPTSRPRRWKPTVPTLRDALGNNAPLTLAAAGAAGSLNANEAIQVGPIVLNVTSSTPNGRYTVGEAVLVAVEFSENVTVAGGPPLLTLETGGTDRLIVNSGGSGTSTLLFNYIIGTGETSGSGDLNYTAVGSLGLNGSTIRNVNADNAFLTLPALAGANSLSGNKDIQVDTSPPTVTTIVRGGGAAQNTNASSVVWRVTFLDNGAGPAGAQGVVNVDETDFTLAVTAGAITGAAVTGVTPVSPLIYDVTVDTGTGNGTLVMNVPAAATIEDVAGTPFATAFNMVAGNSYIIEKTAPVITGVSSTTANGTYRAGLNIDIQIAFSETVLLAPA